MSKGQRTGNDKDVSDKPTLATYRISMSAGDHALTEIRRYQMAEKPPSTANSTPFTKLESSEARNSATVAISSD